MSEPMCLACRQRPSITIIEDGWTPLCAECVELVGTEIAIGQRTICHIGSIAGVVVAFEYGTWRESGLAEVAHDDGTTGWYPLAELAPATAR